MKDKKPPAQESKGGESAKKASGTELLLRAREGDSRAFDMLVKQYRPMLGAAAAQYRGEVNDQDFEEIEQEALLAFHRAVMKYDLRIENVSFGLYAKICVNKAIISALRKISHRKKHFELLPIDAAKAIDAKGPADILIERENEQRLKDLINAHLSEFESRVWWMYYSGAGADDIAEREGKSKKSIENAISRAKSKLRMLLAENK